VVWVQPRVPCLTAEAWAVWVLLPVHVCAVQSLTPGSVFVSVGAPMVSIDKLPMSKNKVDVGRAWDHPTPPVRRLPVCVCVLWSGVFDSR
jgi:hypothetical protein